MKKIARNILWGAGLTCALQAWRIEVFTPQFWWLAVGFGLMFAAVEDRP